jgi:nucleoside-triphosphatase
MINNILITGKINSGKSTLINRIIEINDLSVKGFRTEPFYEEGERVGFFICPADLESELNQIQKEEYLIGRIIGYKQVKPYTENFEKWGVEYLKKACGGSCVILMDELGIIEKEAYQFQEAVMKCLDSSQLTICSIRDEESPFLDRVRAHGSVQLFSVNEHNRNDLVESVNRLIEKYLEENRNDIVENCERPKDAL